MYIDQSRIFDLQQTIRYLLFYNEDYFVSQLVSILFTNVFLSFQIWLTFVFHIFEICLSYFVEVCHSHFGEVERGTCVPKGTKGYQSKRSIRVKKLIS